MEITDIDPNGSKVIKGEILISNLENVWDDCGCLIVNAFNSDGSYHNTYMTTQTYKERGEMSYENAVIRCLREGIKVSEVQRFIKTYPQDGDTSWR